MPELQAIARYTVNAGRETELRLLLPQYAEIVRTESGNLSFEAYQQIDEPRKYVLIERYRSREAFAEHCETQHFKDFVLTRFIPMLEQRTVELQDVQHGQPDFASSDAAATERV
jgi:quinol monooxygenase YgiN